jgi:hypothetical protein
MISWDSSMSSSSLCRRWAWCMVWCAAEKFNVSQSSCLLRVYWSCDIPLQVLQHPKQQQQPCTISWLP